MIAVASFTDAWIETTRKPGMSVEGKVASFTDAWIETSRRKGIGRKERSHLLQMRGLKQLKISLFSL